MPNPVCSIVAFEKASKTVLGLGAPDPAFIARGEENFVCFATVLNDHLQDRVWLTGERLTIADLSIGAFAVDRYFPANKIRNESLKMRSLK